MNSTTNTPHALVADVGGTNTRVALARGGRVLPDTIHRYPNRENPDLWSILRRYLAEQGAPACSEACVALAGPVRDGEGRMTNLKWRIDGEGLRAATGARKVAILNDLQAQGHALGHVDEDMISTVLERDPGALPARATRLVIGIGTGFNSAAVHEIAGGRHVVPSESGHAGLPVQDEAGLALAQWLRARHGFAAVEDVLSGRGLERLHLWLGQRAGGEEALSAAEIVRAAGTDEAANETLRHFARVLGAVAGDLALIHLPFGGIYLAGGVARAVAPHLGASGFAEAFRDKGRFSGFMRNFPVFLIEDDYAALTGCARHLAALP